MIESQAVPQFGPSRGAGTILPKLALFSLMDLLTRRKCVGADPTLGRHTCPHTQMSGRGENACTAAGGECAVEQDGYYMLSYAMVAIGVLIFLWLRVLLPKLDALPLEQWRAKKRRQ
jgi:hypothetical protein